MKSVVWYIIDAALWSLIVAGMVYGYAAAENLAVFFSWAVSLQGVFIAVVIVAYCDDPMFAKVAESFRKISKLARIVSTVSAVGKIAMFAAFGFYATAAALMLAFIVLRMARGIVLDKFPA